MHITCANDECANKGASYVGRAGACPVCGTAMVPLADPDDLSRFPAPAPDVPMEAVPKGATPAGVTDE